MHLGGGLLGGSNGSVDWPASLTIYRELWKLGAAAINTAGGGALRCGNIRPRRPRLFCGSSTGGSYRLTRRGGGGAMRRLSALIASGVNVNAAYKRLLHQAGGRVAAMRVGLRIQSETVADCRSVRRKMNIDVIVACIVMASSAKAIS